MLACILVINRAVSSNTIITVRLAIPYCFGARLPRQKAHSQHQAHSPPGCAPWPSIQEDRGPPTTKDIPQGSISIQLRSSITHPMCTAILISHPPSYTSFDDHNLSDARSNIYLKQRAINQAQAPEPRHLYTLAIQTTSKAAPWISCRTTVLCQLKPQQVQSSVGCYNVGKHAVCGHKLHSEPVIPVMSYKYVSEV